MTLVDEEVIALAITLFNPHGSKQNTFFDAIIAAVAKQQKADAILSFDGWYTKQGLTLASDLLEPISKPPQTRIHKGENRGLEIGS